jgi:hypothetical protein
MKKSIKYAFYIFDIALIYIVISFLVLNGSISQFKQCKGYSDALNASITLPFSPINWFNNATAKNMKHLIPVCVPISSFTQQPMGAPYTIPSTRP